MELVNKGKKLLTILVVSYVILHISAMVFSSTLLYAMGDTEEATYGLVADVIALGLYCFLFWFIFKGHNWARIVMAVLCGIGGIISVIAGLAGDPFMVLSAVLSIAIVYILLSKPVVAYQRYKREGTVIAGDPPAGA